jgi:hypothetical protein
LKKVEDVHCELESGVYVSNKHTYPPDGTLAIHVGKRDKVGVFKVFKYKDDSNSEVEMIHYISRPRLIPWKEEEHWWYEAVGVSLKYIKRKSD